MSEEIKEIEYSQVCFNQNQISSNCEDTILKAKRLLFEERADNNSNASEVLNSRKNKFYFMLCENNFYWENCKDLPIPKISLIEENVNSYVDNETKQQLFVDDVFANDRTKLNPLENCKLKICCDELLNKYFNIWRKRVKLKHEKLGLENKIDQNQKLDKFIKKLRYKQHEQTKCFKKTISEQPRTSSNNYKHRFIAQKNTIDMQKAKLAEQNKLIEELKLGIIREDLLKSVENAKINIREIFSSCSEKIKCKMPILFIPENQDFMISTQKAPKIIQQMEQKALVRAQNRQIILERKHLIEETRQKMLEEAIEKKRVMEDEERKRTLTLIRERQKKELELGKIRQENKQKYLVNLNKAISFYKQLLIKHCFKKLYINFRNYKDNSLLATEHFRTHTLKKVMLCWCYFIEEKYEVKYKIADDHFAYKTLKKVVKIWHDFYNESVQNMQVAEDIYDFRLSSNIFTHWQRYVCSQIMLRDKQMKIAQNHYKRRILLQYYYQWRSLPAVIQLEKAKELKKQKWREKVWEILPDYKPPEHI